MMRSNPLNCRSFEKTDEKRVFAKQAKALFHKANRSILIYVEIFLLQMEDQRVNKADILL